MKLVLTLNDDLVHALYDLANWEKRDEIALAAELVRMVLKTTQPERDLRFRYASLTSRERQVAALVRQGLPNSHISQELCITPGTVKAHLYNIRYKLGVRTSPEIRELLAHLSNGFEV